MRQEGGARHEFDSESKKPLDSFATPDLADEFEYHFKSKAGELRVKRLHDSGSQFLGLIQGDHKVAETLDQNLTTSIHLMEGSPEPDAFLNDQPISPLGIASAELPSQSQ